MQAGASVPEAVILVVRVVHSKLLVQADNRGYRNKDERTARFLQRTHLMLLWRKMVQMNIRFEGSSTTSVTASLLRVRACPVLGYLSIGERYALPSSFPHPLPAPGRPLFPSILQCLRSY